MRLKKIAALVMAAALAVSMFTSCGWDEEEDGSSSSSSSSSSTSDNNSSGDNGSTGGASTSGEAKPDEDKEPPEDEGDENDSVSVTVQSPTGQTKDFSSQVKEAATTAIMDFSNNSSKINDLADEWVNSYRKDANEDGQVSLQEQQMIDMLTKIQQYIKLEGLDLSGVSVDENGLNESLQLALSSVMGQIGNMSDANEVFSTIVERVAQNEGWMGEYIYYINVVPEANASSIITATADDLTNLILKYEAIAQALGGGTWKYEAGVVPVLTSAGGAQPASSYYVILFVAVEQVP